MLFIATPLYENKVSIQYMDAVFQTAQLFAKKGFTTQYCFEQSTYIGINRERLARKFLETSCAYFMFIDADTVFTPLDIATLISSDVDLVSGIYTYRKAGSYGIPFIGEDGKMLDLRGPTLQECQFVPTGMMLVRRTVFEQLYQKHEFLFDQGFRKGRHNPFTDTDPVSNNFEGEDVNFCRIWREHGGKIHANTEVKVGHLGEFEYKVPE
jgi:hypothetical protein